jgi:hypothetical protein
LAFVAYFSNLILEENHFPLQHGGLNIDLPSNTRIRGPYFSSLESTAYCKPAISKDSDQAQIQKNAIFRARLNVKNMYLDKQYVVREESMCQTSVPLDPSQKPASINNASDDDKKKKISDFCTYHLDQQLSIADCSFTSRPLPILATSFERSSTLSSASELASGVSICYNPFENSISEDIDALLLSSGPTGKKQDKNVRDQSHNCNTILSIQDLNKPLRPLSAYNYFFRDERERIIRFGIKYEPANKCSYTPKHQDLLLHNHWNHDRAKKRVHRKSHGKITFTCLSKLVSKRWRSLSVDQKDFYKQIAAKDWKRYQLELQRREMKSSS